MEPAFSKLDALIALGHTKVRQEDRSGLDLKDIVPTTNKIKKNQMFRRTSTTPDILSNQ